METRLIYVTVETEEEAMRIGNELVKSRLAACVNLIGGMTSLYWWEGKVQQGAEVVLIAKTRAELVDALTEQVKSLHSYSCPCVVALPLLGGNQDFLEWIGTETRSA